MIVSHYSYHISGWCNVSLECRVPGATENLTVVWESEDFLRELAHRRSLGLALNSWTLSLSLPLHQTNTSLTCVVSNPADRKNATLHLESICLRQGASWAAAPQSPPEEEDAELQVWGVYSNPELKDLKPKPLIQPKGCAGLTRAWRAVAVIPPCWPPASPTRVLRSFPAALGGRAWLPMRVLKANTALKTPLLEGGHLQEAEHAHVPVKTRNTNPPAERLRLGDCKEKRFRGARTPDRKGGGHEEGGGGASPGHTKIPLYM
ncbi:hypothetical protein J0S82_016834 [Galemys pyrenaicus]|uniref:Ig-like domain-containing protein n=1 Tax=Galemys pyrenaicus TaxID=202257 RepID=A0A8J6DTA6_GALPY|nr:hypothetical protein J0S82_016834 [Galemys pyrenaicus]